MSSLDDDDFFAARWSGRGTGPKRSGLTWRGRIGVAFVGFGALVPVAAALRDDASVAPLAETRSVTAVVPALRATPGTPTAAPDTAVPTTAAPTTAVPTTAAPAVASPSAPVVTAPACPQRFEVRPGDSWYGLAAASDVPVRDLFALNGAGPSTMLYPGRSICLPAQARRPPPTTVRTITSTTVTITIPPPTVASAPPGVPVPARTSVDEALRIIREVWPPELHTEAIRVASRESRLQSNVRNACCIGLFQIHFEAHRRWLGTQGVTIPEQLLDAATNVRVALALHQRSGGWGPWGL